MQLPMAALAAAMVASSTVAAPSFSWKEIVGRVGDRSATVNAVPDQRTEIRWDVAEADGDWIEASAPAWYDSGAVAEAVLSGLRPDTPYRYRMRYREAGADTTLRSGAEHAFHTARPAGSNFVFAIQADPHQDAATDSGTYAATQGNIVADRPDFLVDLGDCFLSEKYVRTDEVLVSRLRLARSWYDRICHSIPLYLTIGNHEGELGWYNNGTDTCFAVRAANARLRYYPNPAPDGFFAGDTSATPFVGRRESWYSWVWGDALFVVLDPYWFAQKGKAAGVERGWDFTLGREQYEWLKRTLRQSPQKFKFVFAHQLVGGDEPFVDGVSQGTGRGGAAWAHLYEMGGYSKTGSLDWSLRRPGWEKPIHDLLVETGVNVFFHGHDHLFSMEEKDGVVYQECPQPGLANYTTAGNAAVYGYGSPTGVLPSSGHLRVVVGPDSTRVEYVRAFVDAPRNASMGWTNGMTAFSYTLKSRTGTAVRRAESSGIPSLSVRWDGDVPVFSYVLPEASDARLTILDPSGRTIETARNLPSSAGPHAWRWTGGRGSGVRIAMLNVDGIVRTVRFSPR